MEELPVLAQLGVMYAAGTAIAEALKKLIENVAKLLKKDIDVPQGAVEIFLVLEGIAFGLLWNISVLELINLPPTISPIADKAFNVIFMGVTFLLGPPIIHDLAKRATGEKPLGAIASWTTSSNLGSYTYTLVDGEEHARPTEAVPE